MKENIFSHWNIVILEIQWLISITKKKKVKLQKFYFRLSISTLKPQKLETVAFTPDVLWSCPPSSHACTTQVLYQDHNPLSRACMFWFYVLLIPSDRNRFHQHRVFPNQRCQGPSLWQCLFIVRMNFPSFVNIGGKSSQQPEPVNSWSRTWPGRVNEGKTGGDLNLFWNKTEFMVQNRKGKSIVCALGKHKFIGES